jgi:diketogulonate reductase-like aldo/keto reductase
MEYRHLGKSGLVISEIAYGNWITHGSQVEEQAAADCVRAALDEGITTFDTADVYAGGRAEEVLGRALHGVRRESLEIFTKVYWPMGDGRNDRGLSRKHITESVNASLRRLQTDYVDLYQAHRYDSETPIEETMRAFDDLVRAGKVLYVGVSEWRAEEIAAALRVAEDLGLDRIVSNQPQYNMLWRVIEPEVVPLPDRAGRAYRQVPAGGRAPRGFPRYRSLWFRLHQAVPQGGRAHRGAAPQAARGRGGALAGSARGGVDAAEPERVRGHYRRHPARPGTGEREGGRRTAGHRPAEADRRGTRPGGHP